MSDLLGALIPYKDAAEIREVNADLVQAIDRRLGNDSRPESETDHSTQLANKSKQSR